MKGLTNNSQITQKETEMKTVEFYKINIPTDYSGSLKPVWFVELNSGVDSFDISNGSDKNIQLSIAIETASENNCAVSYT